jgi:hypothetical protein
MMASSPAERSVSLVEFPRVVTRLQEVPNPYGFVVAPGGEPAICAWRWSARNGAGQRSRAAVRSVAPSPRW